MKFLSGLWQGWREFWALSWWGKGPVLAILALLLMIAIASGGGSGDAASDDSGPSVQEAARDLLAKTPQAPKATPIVPRGGPLTDITTPQPEPTVFVTVGSPSPTVIVPSPTVIIQEAEPPAGPGSSFGNGVYAVGADVQPGSYRTSGPEAGRLFCYWARLSGFGGSLDEIIANDNSGGPTVVTISPSDIGFESSGCGTWTRID